MGQGTRKSFEGRERIRIETESTESYEGHFWFRVHVLRFIFFHWRVWSKVFKNNIVTWWNELFSFMLSINRRIAQPLCLGMLLQYFRADSTMPTWQAYLYATGVVLSSASYIFTIHPYYFGIQHVGMKLRIASCSLIYKKVLVNASNIDKSSHFIASHMYHNFFGA